MANIFYDDKASLDILEGKTVSIIGFGSQGHAHALNLKESGVNVIVGLREGSSSKEEAENGGLEIRSVSEAAKAGDLVAILTPDETQKEIYYRDIEPNLAPGNALLFAHGFNIHFSQIVPKDDVDVIMVAPKGPGKLVREMYEKGVGVPALVAIYQDSTGKAMEKALAYAKGLKATKAGVIETTFKEETETDLFGEQCVLCGGTSELIRAGFDTLVDAGYQPEIAYFECLHELKLIVDLIHTKGITGMRDVISNTAEYGDMIIGKKIITNDVRKEMKKALADIQNGKFARKWILENMAGKPAYNAIKKKEKEHLVEKVGKKLRSMMSWIEG